MTGRQLRTAHHLAMLRSGGLLCSVEDKDVKFVHTDSYIPLKAWLKAQNGEVRTEYRRWRRRKRSL